jgi:O-acetyl-ADP-ribose deacetylase (regulator of RNase III)/ADP-ribose pyrophosphatase YjhB (NUDIX family)
MNIKGCAVNVVQADITTLQVDAIVNAANNTLVMGGGVAAAIKKKGGKVIEAEAVKQGPIAIGQAIATSAGSLPCAHVIHTVTMGMDFQTDEHKVRLSCRNALRVAEEIGAASVAFPALGCGTGGFPYLAAAKIMAQETLRHLRENKSRLKEIIFCLYDAQAYETFRKGALGYLEHVTTALGDGPYITVDAIIEVAVPGENAQEGIVIIQRSNPPFGWALPGGFVDYGESLEEAVKREMKEETGLALTELRQFHTYSEPGRDPRFHTVACVFVAKGEGTPKAGDDASGLKVISLSEIAGLEFAFDHKKILTDYLAYKKGAHPF